jgi:hypothetical protein
MTWHVCEAPFCSDRLAQRRFAIELALSSKEASGVRRRVSVKAREGSVGTLLTNRTNLGAGIAVMAVHANNRSALIPKPYRPNHRLE